MDTELWWLWIVLFFIVVAFVIWLFGRKKETRGESMAHPVEQTLEVTSRTEAIETSRTPDNLEIIEGIGPKIAGILIRAGFDTYSALAAASTEQLEQVLIEAKLRHLANPATWGRQAALAAAGKWDELKSYQDTLNAGREA
jgi:predicted flap endonuclease-1-like 5' DNA nuclease